MHVYNSESSCCCCCRCFFFSFFGTKTKSACIIFVLINIKMDEENKRHALYLRRHSKDCLFFARCVVVYSDYWLNRADLKKNFKLWDEVLCTISTSQKCLGHWTKTIFENEKWEFTAFFERSEKHTKKNERKWHWIYRSYD